MHAIGSKIEEMLEAVSHDDVSVKPADIKAALKHLKKERHDGMRYTVIWGLIWASDYLLRHLVALLSHCFPEVIPRVTFLRRL